MTRFQLRAHAPQTSLADRCPRRALPDLTQPSSASLSASPATTLWTSTDASGRSGSRARSASFRPNHAFSLNQAAGVGFEPTREVAPPSGFQDRDGRQWTPVDASGRGRAVGARWFGSVVTSSAAATLAAWQGAARGLSMRRRGGQPRPVRARYPDAMSSLRERGFDRGRWAEVGGQCA
jgi:hypothetical protein